MYCKECGKEINENAVICVSCGCATGKISDVTNNIFLAYVIWFLLGYFGLHRFYLGQKTSAIVMLICGVLSILLAFFIIPLIIMWVWWLVDACLIPSMIRNNTQ
jgi:TM2 domain-containing membrane protein YozV